MQDQSRERLSGIDTGHRRVEGEPGWTIIEGVELPSDRDGALFEWRYNVGSEQRSIFVHISGTALAVDRETLPRHVADAVTTHGRSAVEDALSRRQTPSRIQVASNGSVFEQDQ
jgi:hypothetical protein